MCTYRWVVVTNRTLCKGTLSEGIDRIMECEYLDTRSNFMKRPDCVIVREKDLSNEEYEELAISVLKKCNEYNVECILHNFIDIAVRLNHKKIHLPFLVFQQQYQEVREFEVVGVSVHSIEELQFATMHGATYVIVGHIFPTNCKQGVLPRGVSFLKELCDISSIPVYAIGGIKASNIEQVQKTKVAGICIMSGYMDLYKNNC